MRKLIAADLGLGFGAAASISAANAQGITRDNAWQYTTGSLKRHKRSATHHARKVSVRGHKVKVAQER